MSTFKVTSTVTATSPDGLTRPSKPFVANGSGYEFDQAGSNTLTIGDDAFVYADGFSSETIWLSSPAGIWTVNVNGQVRGTGVNSFGLVAQGKSLKLTVGDNGSIVGAAAGVAALDTTPLDLTNNGYIGGTNAVQLGFETVANKVFVNKVTNNGTMVGKIVYFQNNALPPTGSTNTTILNNGILMGDIDLSLAAGTKGVTNGAGHIIGGNLTMGEGANTLTNSGLVNLSNLGTAYTGGSGSDTIINKLGGQISATVSMGDGKNSLTNDGSVGGPSGYSYIGGTGDDTVTNNKTGVILSGVSLGTAVAFNTVINAGTIGSEFASGITILGDASDDKVTNSGTLVGGVSLGNGTNSLINSKHVGFTLLGQSYVGGTGNDTVTNNAGGQLIGAVLLGSGSADTNTVTNYGQIGGSITGTDGVDKIYNKLGGILSAVDVSGGANTVENAGTILNLTGGDGGNIFKNSGIISQNVTTGTAHDEFSNLGAGKVLGFIDLGAGDDKFTGGASDATVKDNLGLDTFNFGAGNDTLVAFNNAADGLDKFDGGGGIDTFDASALSVQLKINLGLLSHHAPSSLAGVPFFSSVVANQSESVGFSPIDSIKNFENVKGSSSGDIIAGSDAANKLEGNAGADDLFGYGGNDSIYGGADSDSIVGGLGADFLQGDAGTDYFVYTSIKDSGTTVATRDTIQDFVHGTDHIDLSSIDADSATAGDQAFHFLVGPNSGSNALWDGSHGALRSVWTPTGMILEGDIDGNRVADFSIFVYDGGTHFTFSTGVNTGDIFL